ncbi:hypothetical protein AX16_009452 [Volvariella volvacea WC 439]|nr:hypothetical protein AX16_009452 [Volvariella volvacea WC 439]
MSRSATAALQHHQGTASPAKVAGLGNATWVEHHFTGDIQARQHRCSDAILGAKWGTSVDVWSVARVLFESLTGRGRSPVLFRLGVAVQDEDEDEDHTTRVMELMGKIPSIALGGKHSAESVKRRAMLLAPRRDSARQANASELVHHNFLVGIVVQGKIDVTWRLEMEENQERVGSRSTNASKTRLLLLRQRQLM